MQTIHTFDICNLSYNDFFALKSLGLAMVDAVPLDDIITRVRVVTDASGLDKVRDILDGYDGYPE